MVRVRVADEDPVDLGRAIREVGVGEGVEEVLGTVSNSTDAMKSTATALIGSSHETTQHADGALRESNDAAANVILVAGSAEEL
jgi:hypothetical protein